MQYPPNQPYQPYYPMPPRRPQPPNLIQRVRQFIALLRRYPILIIPTAIVLLAVCGFVGSAAVAGVVQGIQGDQSSQSQAQVQAPTATPTQVQIVAAATLVATPAPTNIPTVKPTAKPTPKPTAKPTPKPVPTQKPQPTPTPCLSPCNPWGYSFSPGNYIYNPPSNFCSYFNCISSFWGPDDPGDGYVIQCQDGTYSQSGNERGACSSHGGELRPLYSH